MRQKSLILILLLSIFAVPVFASHSDIELLRDSVRTEKIGDQSFIIHEVEPKETLFGISRRYQSAVGDIVSSNPELKQGLKIGQTIRIPFISKAEVPPGADLHNVAPGETLFSIAKQYGLTVEEIMSSNGLKGNDLSVGQSLIVRQTTPVAQTQNTSDSETETKPSEVKKIAEEKPKAVEVIPEKVIAVEEPVKIEKAEKPTRTEETSRSEASRAAAGMSKPIVPGEWRTHTVSSGETLFAIAKQYDARVEDIITWNALSSNNLKQGQELKVGRGAPEESKVPIVGNPRVVSDISEMNVDPNPENTSGGFKNIKENGQAELIEGTGTHKKYLVLHRTAPVGTIMRVKNEENDVTVFARVVGVLPETGDNSKLIIKLSQAAFDQLRAVNGRFPVEVMY